VYWGSHGCDRDWPHVGPCCCIHEAYDEDGDKWSPLTLNCGQPFGEDADTAVIWKGW
jgi:hypothetical protein